MLSKETIIGTVLLISFFMSSQAFAAWKRTELAYWGASGAAHCLNDESITIWVGMSYLQESDALTELWNRAVTVCQNRGGLYDISGKAYCQQGPYW